MLNIVIEKIGKIDKASIEIDGITVIAGLNGTGKSTIAKGVFASLNSRKNILSKIRNDQCNDISSKIDEWIDINTAVRNVTEVELEDEFFFNASDDLAEQIMEMQDDNKWNVNDAYQVIYELIQEYFDAKSVEADNIADITEQILAVLGRNRNEYVEFFVNQYYKDVFHGQMNRFGMKETAGISYRKMVGSKKITSKVTVTDNTVKLEGKILTIQQENAIYVETHSVLDICEERGSGSRRLRRNNISVPTRELMGCLIRGNKNITFSEQQMLEANKDIIEDIISRITHGRLQKNQNGIMEFVDQEVSEKIEFSNMSSGLKIFAVIQKLLENTSLKSGDVLIVDEPEVNLHPEWQVVLADTMVRIYKELGIYIVVNSHSPYFIRAIEVKMAEYECALAGRYYYLEDTEQGCVCRNITNSMNVVYEALYRPLDSL